MAGLSEKCIDKLCHLTAGIAVAGGAVAGAGAVVLTAGPAQALLGSGGLMGAILGSRRGEARKVVERVKKRVARDYREWIAVEYRSDPRPEEANLDDAIAAFNRVLPDCMPTQEDIVGVHLDGAKLADLLLAKGADYDVNFCEDGHNPAGPRVFRAIVEGTWNVLRTTPEYYDRLRSYVDQRILEGIGEVRDGVVTIREVQDAHSTMLAEILARVSAEKAVPTAPLRAILERLGEAEVADDEIVLRLEDKAEEYIVLREQLLRDSNQHPEVVAVRREALAKMEAGELDDARAIFTRARERIREARHEWAREEALLLADEAQIDRLELRYRDAARKLAAAADIVAESHVDQARQYRIDQGVVLCRLGTEFGENDALLEAIDVFKALIATTDRALDPLGWAMLQDWLGVAHGELGARERGAERLEEAVDAFRSALEERTREGVPLDWARTQINLSNTLHILGKREHGTGRLKDAVDAIRATLQETTRERAPLEWAKAQINLGNVLLSLGHREGNSKRIEDAVAASREALRELTRERAPLLWAVAQHNLGEALSHLGERERSVKRLKEAVAAYSEALSERTRERVPLSWARTLTSLAYTLVSLGQHTGTTALLEDAVAGCREALQERTRERAPLDWAKTQNVLGTALTVLAWRLNDTARLEEAVLAYRAALEERSRERAPLDRADTLVNLGAALAALGERNSGTIHLEEAEAALRAALEEYSSQRYPLQRAGAQLNLARVLLHLGTRLDDRLRLEESLIAIDKALEGFREANAKLFIAQAEELRPLIIGALEIW